MEFLKKLSKIVLIAALAIVASVSALAYTTVYPMEYGQHRIGAYTSISPYGQGFYNYMTPPIALTRYGNDYSISNIRTAVYPNYPYTYLPSMQRPYFGYPYGIDRAPAVRYSSSGNGFY